MPEAEEDNECKRIFSRNILVGCLSNLSTAYNMININIVHVLMQQQYCGGDFCIAEVDIASTASLVGCSIGQLSFGIIGDWLGRPKAMQLTMGLSMFGAILSACAVPITSEPKSVFYFMAASRLLMGVGLGGVYPLSATIALETAGGGQQGRAGSVVFSMQGVGYLLCPLFAMLFIALCGTPEVLEDGKPRGMGWNWRLTTALGALPGLCLIFLRGRDTTPVSNQSEVQTNELAALEDISSSADSLNNPEKEEANASGHPYRMSLLEALAIPENRVKLIGTAGCWFLFDFTFYGNQLFQTTVLRDVFDHNSNVVGLEGSVSNDLLKQMIIIAAIALPGYYVSVWLLDSLGRRNIQLQGFLLMALDFAALGAFYEHLRKIPALLLVLYGLTFFFSNFGPNATTFIVAGETYPTEIRATMHGMSASLGMMGATIGSAVFKPLSVCSSCSSLSPHALLMLICSGIATLGFIFTYFFVEDRRGGMVESPRSPYAHKAKGYGSLPS